MHVALRERVARATARNTGVPLTRAGARIVVLLQERSIGLSDLIGLVGVDQSTISRQVQELGRLGLVQRTAKPGDGRAVVIGLTHLGEQVAAELRMTRHQFLSRALRTFSPGEIKELENLLGRLEVELVNAVTGEGQEA